MLDVFARNKSRDLAGFLVWVPMLKADKKSAIPLPSIEEKRIRQSWDHDLSVSAAITPVLKLKQKAWDVYLIYPGESRWDGIAPPAPSFWMHQLSRPECGAPPERRLDSKVFEERVRELVEAL